MRQLNFNIYQRKVNTAGQALTIISLLEKDERYGIINSNKTEVKTMLAIFAVLSDIPAYIAAAISQLTGADTSEFLDLFNGGFAKVIEFAETLLGG